MNPSTPFHPSRPGPAAQPVASLPTVSVATMQDIDAAAIAGMGIPRLLLMEHAGLAVARAAQQMVPAPAVIVVCCGTGLNGGDGLAASRHLHAWGYAVRVLVAGGLDRLREEPAIYATMLQRLGIPLLEWDTERTEPRARTTRWAADCQLIIDALLGIGTRGPVREPLASLIAWMNRSGTPILSVDIPSGLDGDTGVPQAVAVKATVTVTFGLAKRGCITGEGPGHVGSLIVDPITIPRQLLTPSHSS